MPTDKRIAIIVKMEKELNDFRSRAIRNGLEVYGTVVILMRDKKDPENLIRTAVTQI